MYGKTSVGLTLGLAAAWMGIGLAQTRPAARVIVGCQPPSDGLSVVVDCDPPAPVRVVVLGSSTALGAGVSPVANSWAGRLGSALRNRGFELSNVSVSGSTTADSLARFDRDVRPLAPRFVILATSIANEGLTDRNTASIAARYLQNTRQLIRRTEEIGAVPVLISPYPNDTFTPRIRDALMALSSGFEAEGVTVWDFLNPVDGGDGRWIAGLSKDGTHPNEAGHLALFDTIPLSFFEMATSPARWPPTMGYGSWKSAAGGELPSIGIGLENPALSWSIAFWLKPDTSTERRSLLAVEGTGVELWRSGSRLEVMAGGTLAGEAGLPSGGGFTHLCLTYQKLSGTLTLYVKGEARVSSAVSLDQAAGFFRLRSGPGAEGESFSRVLVYRTPLNAGDVKDLLEGRLHFKSLEADVALTESPARGLVNRAGTSVRLVSEGEWTWTPAGPRLGVVD